MPKRFGDVANDDDKRPTSRRRSDDNEKPNDDKSVIDGLVRSRLAGVGASDCGQLADGGGLEWPRVRRLSKPIITTTTTTTDGQPIAIAAGAMHTLVLTNDGRLVSFGCGDDGATGRRNENDNIDIVRTFWPAVGKPLTIRPVIVGMACGDAHSAAVDNLGRVWSFGVFGDARTGRIGFPADDYLPTAVEPRLIVGGGCGAGWTGRIRAVSVACGEGHTVILADPGLLVEYGVPTDPAILLRRPSDDQPTDDSYKRLQPRLLSISLPTDATGEQNLVDAVYAGGRSTFARLVGSGQIIARGVNNYGQLGIGRISMYENWSVVPIDTGNRVRKIAAAEHHTVMLVDTDDDDKSMVFTCGRATYGRLGRGGPVGKTWTAADDRSTFEPVPLPTKTIDIAVGPASTHLVGADGRCWSFGSGPTGQLGIAADVDETHVPTDVRMPANFKAFAVAAGAQHTVFLSASA